MYQPESSGGKRLDLLDNYLKSKSEHLVKGLTSRTDVIEMEGMLTESDTLTDSKYGSPKR